MGKGDGKKKRPKKKTTTSTTDSSTTPSPTPQRVTNNINIPVRHQIKMVQLYKESQKAASTPGYRKPKQRTSYRRTWDEEEMELKAEERRRKGQDPDWDVILNQTASAPLVIVDGYNIIHKWPRLKKHMSKGDPQRARQLLIDELENLRTIKGWRIECVFDGTRRSTTGPLGSGPGGSSATTGMDRATKKDVSKFGVRCVFTGVGVEADAYIEARCAEAKNVTVGKLTSSFIVATDDGMIRMAAQGAGAMCMSAERFVTELKSVRKAVEYRVEAAMAKVNGVSMRPEKLRGTTIQMGRFGRRSVMIEDKRNRTKPVAALPLQEVHVEVEEDEDGVPWWAKVPNSTRYSDRFS